MEMELIKSEETSDINEIKFLYKIYTLTDPFTNEIRYVGRTRQTLKKRITGHISEVKRNKLKNNKLTHKENWIMSIIDKGSIPIISEIHSEKLTIKESAKCELYYIKEYSKNNNLTNEDDHGIGFIIENEKTKPVYQYDLEGNFISKYLNANVAGTELNINDGNIGKCAKGDGRIAGNYYWSYELFEKYPIRDKIKAYKSVYKFDLNKTLLCVYDSLINAANDNNINYKLLSKYCKTCEIIENSYYSYNENCTKDISTKNKPVAKLDENKNIIETFNSAKEAAEKCGLKNSSAILLACKNNNKKSASHYWMYL